MKICVSSTGKDLDAPIDPRFGRCQYFLVVDVDSMAFEVVSNESAVASGGAGVQAGQSVARAGVDAVITGNIGPNAYQTLKAAGIKVITGASGTVKDVVEKYKKGELQEVDAPSVGSHFGMGGGTGFGRGRRL